MKSIFRRLQSWLGWELVEVSAAEKVVSGLAGLIAIFGLLWITHHVLPWGSGVGVVASMGASAVLLFAVPHGPLSQPWPVLAGHTFSALIGVMCARWISHPELAAASAVGISIGAMLLFKCVHPPGGATALTAVIGGTPIHELGLGFVLYPVLINAALMVLLAVVLNAFFSWRRYPMALHQRSKAGASSHIEATTGPTHEEVLAALRSLDSFVDIAEEDLIHLVRKLQRPLSDGDRKTGRTPRRHNHRPFLTGLNSPLPPRRSRFSPDEPPSER